MRLIDQHKSACAKAACEILMKLAPGVNFTNILQVGFLYRNVLYSFSLLTVWLCIFFFFLAKGKMGKGWL